MELFDVLSLTAGVVATVLSIMSYRRSRLADEANAKYEELRERLAEIELQRAKSANIRLEFVPAPREHLDLIIHNDGAATAYDVVVSFEAIEEGVLPPNLKNIRPILKLAAGQSISVRTILASGISRVLKGTWCWKNPDGHEQEQESEFWLP